MSATRRWSAFLRGPFFPIWPATALLFLISPLLARGSLEPSTLSGLAPFAAILAIASIGQTLVVQQRGLDLSIPGVVSLATVIITLVPDGDDALLPVALLLTFGACGLAGLLSGVAVTRFGITPLIATLGVNALLIGAVLQLTGGTSKAIAAPALDAFAFGKTVGIPNTVLVALVALAVVSFIVRATLVGRRFVAVGANPAAALAAGIRVRAYEASAYVIAALFGGLAGILLAGYVGTPGLLAGEQYLLPSIAAVVLGGTSLVGGRGSVVATAVGAVFLVQLQSVVRGMGAPASVQLIILGLIIGLGMAARRVDRSRFAAWRSRGRKEVMP
jgi:ribose transport system permease protein